jgi:hypothetical protein
MVAENTPVKINTVTLEPPTVKRGIILNVTIQGEQCMFFDFFILTQTVIDEVTGGKIDMPVFLRGRQLFRYGWNLCDVLHGGCPGRKGDFVSSLIIKTPSVAFSGNYTTITKTSNLDGLLLSCVELWFTLD